MLLESFLSVLFPECCPLCGKYVGDQQFAICSNCLDALPRTEQAFKRENGTEMIFKDVEHLQRAAAFLFYDHRAELRNVIHQMKYQERPELGYQLGVIAAREFQEHEFFDGIDVIIPVPLHEKRFRERGYNQSEWIARGLSEVTGIEMDTTHLLRRVNNSKQAMLSSGSREDNVKDVFGVVYPEDMYHKHILLVDDIITTGATIRSCLNAMKAFRGSSFSVFALGKAR